MAGRGDGPDRGDSGGAILDQEQSIQDPSVQEQRVPIEEKHILVRPTSLGLRAPMGQGIPLGPSQR